MLDIYRVSLASLDAIAEGSRDVAVVARLAAANRSHRLALVRSILDSTRGTSATDRLPSLDDVWTLLADVQRLNQAAVEAVVTHPGTGLWATRIVRRLGESNDGPTPLWADLGYLHQMAVAAAIRAGHDFRTWVPVWRGAVMLPSLGMADLPSSGGEWGIAEVRGESGHVVILGPDGTIRIPDDYTVDGPGWSALRVVGMAGCDLWLDDLDPYREYDGPVPAQRLSSAEFEMWTASLDTAWELLTRHHPATAAELATGLHTLVPRTDAVAPYSASHQDAFGSVLLARPVDAVTFAETLVHEFQHSKFGVLLSLVDLLEPDGDNETPSLYAPWRDDPRTAVGVLHGMYSFFGVAAFYREHWPVATGPDATAAQFEFAYRRQQTERAIESLRAGAALSPLGHRFLDRAQAQLREWTAEPLPADVRDAAHRANLDHYLTWRLRNLQPPADAVAELADAWSHRRAKPDIATESRLNPAPGGVRDARLALVRTGLAARTHPGTATEADLALVGGRAAVDLYRQEVLASSALPTGWSGLALASGASALTTRPELVSAVYHEVLARTGEPPDPIRLARWLG